MVPFVAAARASRPQEPRGTDCEEATESKLLHNFAGKLPVEIAGTLWPTAPGPGAAGKYCATRSSGMWSIATLEFASNRKDADVVASEKHMNSGCQAATKDLQFAEMQRQGHPLY